MKHNLLLGTAGHIDHGKTALVRALTGVDTDRLPDEKRRQITIDLGFAPLQIGNYSIGIVDVPGHERFVRNMLAGAAGLDLALLVVAADDSVKPQTREHREILEHLRLDTGLVVITKCDLVESDWIELVESEVRELTTGTFLADVPMLRVSAHTGSGLEELREAIATAAKNIIQHREPKPTSHFRLAVDRAFTIAGHGTVVTGSVSNGQVRVGDALELQPQGTTVRVRGLQSHGESIEEVKRGQRAAINLAGIHYQEVSRGQSLASCGTLHASSLLTVQLRLSDQFSGELKHRTAVRLHLGTASIPGKVSLLGTSSLEPSGIAYAQLFLSQPTAAVWGQPFVIRNISPVETLGGGRVLDPQATRIKQYDADTEQLLDNLAGDDPLQRALAAAFFASSRDWQPDDWSVLAGVKQIEATREQLVQQQLLISIQLANGQTRYFHHDIATRLTERVFEVLKREHHRSPLRKYVERSRLTQHFRQVPEEVTEALCTLLHREDHLILDKRGVALATWTPQLTKVQQDLLAQILQLYQTAQIEPPLLDQAATKLGAPTQIVAELVEVAVESGDLVRISPNLLLDRKVEEQTRVLLKARMASGESLTVSQIRDLLGTSRKIAVPLCEYLDSIGVTQRHGDLRRLTACPRDSR